MNKDKIIKFWFWVGRVLPLTALALLMVALVFDLNSVLEYLLTAIAILFATFAFSWWWWVLDTVKSLHNMLSEASNRFEEVITELRDIKKQFNDSDRKRTKQTPNRSK